MGYQSKREKNKFTAQLTQAVDAEEIADRGILIIAEASDDVVQGGLSDDEDDEAQFRGIGAEQEGFDGIEEKDGDLARAESKLDTLEQSMGNLEHWLEDKVWKPCNWWRVPMSYCMFCACVVERRGYFVWEQARK